MHDLKTEILDNPFVDSLRLEFRVDLEAYSRLVPLLKALSARWSNESLIDKELASILYVLPQVVRYQSERSEYTQAEREQLKNIEVELDAIILDCLSPGG